MIRFSKITQEDIDEMVAKLRQKMVDRYGYNHQSAQDVIDHVAALLARGE